MSDGIGLPNGILNVEAQEHDSVPENMAGQKLFSTFYAGLRRANFNSEQETNYFNDMTTQRDINNQIKFAQEKGYAEGEAKGYAAGQARGLADGHAKGLAKGLAEGKAEGHAEGLAEGLAEGETKGKMDDARAMLADGLGIDKVEKYTGLSKESLEALLAEIQK